MSTAKHIWHLMLQSPSKTTVLVKMSVERSSGNSRPDTQGGPTCIMVLYGHSVRKISGGSGGADAIGF